MYEVLKITDGTTSKNFLSLPQGFWLESYEPGVARSKNGGVFQSSDLAPSRRLVYRQFGSVEDTLVIGCQGFTADHVVSRLQELLALLEKAIAHFTTDWQDTVVYMERNVQGVTYPEYGVIGYYEIPELVDFFKQPFARSSQQKIIRTLTLNLEYKEAWLADIPGQSTCVQVHNYQSWRYDEVWEQIDNTGVPSISGIIADNGDILVGIVNNPPAFNISDDNGDTWNIVNIAGASSGNPQTITKLPNGDLLCCTSLSNDIYLSDDNGATWASIATEASGLLYAAPSSGYVFSYNDSTFNLERSTDSGANWSTLGFIGQIYWFFEDSAGTYLFAGTTTGLHRSSDNGATWETVLSVPSNAYRHIAEGDNNRLFLTYDNSVAHRIFAYSDDFGTTWILAFDFLDLAPGTNFQFMNYPILYTSQGILYLIGGTTSPGVTTYVFRSSDNGISWTVEVILSGVSTIATAGPVLEANNGRVIVGTNDDIWGKGTSDPTTMGQTNTCLDQVFFANSSRIANLTNILVNDASPSGFTEIFPLSGFPVDLFPSTPATSDIIYFGMNATHVNYGPFNNLIFDLASPLVLASGSLTLAWEYYNGSWTALDVTDGTASFQITGVRSVHWEQPSDWTATTINSISALWVRARITTTGSPTFSSPPTQQNRNIYSVVEPYIEIDATEVKGDIPALMRSLITNRSDLDGSNDPTLFDQRVIVGLRSVSKGTNFQAYINLSDVQAVDGITVILGTNTAFASAVSDAPTGRRSTWSAGAGETSYADRVLIDLTTAVARDFYGEYRMFVRARQTSGSAGDISIRVQYRVGTGGIQFTTKPVRFDSTDARYLLDLGKLKMPVGALNSNDLGDISRIAIQGLNTSGAGRTVHFYDLILIPIDEWSLDSQDFTNSSASMVGGQNSTRHMLDVDGLVDFRTGTRTIVRTTPGDFATSIYTGPVNGIPMLQGNALQRLWFLCAKYVSTSTKIWVSEHEVCHSIRIFKNQRYLGLRGNN